MNQIDRIIHYMRQSKMDAVRSRLELLAKESKKKNKLVSESTSYSLGVLESFFRATSNDAPLP